MNLYKFAAVGAAMLATMFSASALTIPEYTEKLYVGTFDAATKTCSDTITPGNAKYLPVSIELSTDSILGLQFDLVHKSTVKVTKKYIKNSEVMPSTDQVVVTPVVSKKWDENLGDTIVTSRVMVVASKNEPLKVGVGELANLMQIQVQAEDAAFNRYPVQELEINNIVMTKIGPNGDGLGFYGENTSSYLILGMEKLGLSCTSENLEIMPGGECTMTIAMENSLTVEGMELKLHLPEGFSLKGYDDNQVMEFCKRAEDCDQQSFRNDGVYKLLAYRLDGDPMTTAKEGDLFSFTVIAPDSLTSDSFEIVLDNFEVSSGEGVNTISYKGQGCTISIANGQIRLDANKAAYDADLKTIEGLQADLDAAVKEILEKTPDYDVKPSQDAIQALIDAQKQQAENALAAVENAGTYENTVDSEAITAAIAKMKEEAATSGVDAITIENLENVKIYTPMGTRVAKLVRNAINIVVLQDGSAKKVFIK